jgi:hypothetical protein
MMEIPARIRRHATSKLRQHHTVVAEDIDKFLNNSSLRILIISSM